MQDIFFTARIFKEGDVFIAHAPELDVMTQGETEQQAGANIVESVQLFLETADKDGTLEEILEESG